MTQSFFPASAPVSAKVIASSIAEDTGARIDTLQLRYPRMVHADFLTHRKFSRNGSSSRAIPHASLTIRDSETYVPQFRHNQPGMAPGEFLSPEAQAEAAAIWQDMADYCRRGTAILAEKTGLNVHKQWVNRPMEWFGYIDVVATSTQWSNFMALRDHDAAQDEIIMLAQAMRAALDAATPQVLPHGHWHLPYVGEDDFERASFYAKRAGEDVVKAVLAQLGQTKLDVSPRNALLLATSAARCCRVSYSKHDGGAPSIVDDMSRYLTLALDNPKHASPLEHQGRPLLDHEPAYLQGNFEGFAQFRKFLPDECL